MKKISIIFIMLFCSINSYSQYLGGVADGYSSKGNNVFAFEEPLEAPVLIFPAYNSTDIITNPTLQWQSDVNASSYSLQVSLTNNFTEFVVNESGIEETSFQLNELEYNTVYCWRVSASNEEITSDWSDVWNFTTELASLELNLSSGWNTISSFVNPLNPNMLTIFSGVANQIRLIKNSFGQICVPAWGINQIGNWNVLSGYQINVVENCNLLISGTLVEPDITPIQLFQGWYLVSYLLYSPMNPSIALQSISGSIICAKDGLGNLYFPAFGINTIGNMQPGQGYWLFMNAPAVLTYPGN